MNETVNTPVVTDPVTLDHFVLGLDDDGNEVKIKVSPTGELVMDDEDKDEVTVH